MKKTNKAIGLTDYFNQLLREWVALLTSSLFAVGYFILGAVNSTYYGKQGLLVLAISVVSFLLATYRAWLKAETKVEELALRLKELEAKIPKYEVKLASEDKYDEKTELDWALSRKKEVSAKIAKLSNNLPWVNFYVPFFTGEPTLESLKSYEVTLDEYATSVKSYAGRLSNNLRHVIVRVRNVGSVSDTDINIQLVGAGGTKLIHEELKPKRPEIAKTHSFLPFSSIPSVNAGGFKRTDVRTTKELVEVEFNRLHVDEEARLLYAGFYVESEKFPATLLYEIRSSNLRETARGSLPVK